MIRKGITKKLVILIIVAIVVIPISITIYYKRVITPVQENITVSPEGVIRSCNQTDFNSRQLCGARRLANNDFNKEAKSLCESLEGDWVKRCVATVLVREGNQSEAIDLCKKIEGSNNRNFCIADALFVYSIEDATKFCLAIENADGSTECTAEIIIASVNKTQAVETCEKIVNITRRTRCIEVVTQR